MKKSVILNVIAIVAGILQFTVVGIAQEKPGQNEQKQIQAEKDQFANRIDPSKYFNHEVVTHCQLSPDGSRYAYAVSVGNELRLYVKQLTGGEPVLLTKLQVSSFEGLRWVNDIYLSYKMTEAKQTIANVYLVRIDNPKGAISLAKPGQKVDWLNEVRAQSEYVYFALDQKFTKSLDLVRYHLKTGNTELVIENPGNVIQWVVDNTGVPVAAMTCQDDHRKFRMVQGRDKLSEEESLDIHINDEFIPLFVSGDDTQLICLSDLNRENTALVALDLTTMSEKKVLYAPSGEDVLGCIFSNIGCKPVGAVHGSGGMMSEIWDDNFKKVYVAAKQKMNKEDDVKIVHANESGSILVLKVSNPKYPTDFYIYQSASGKLEVVNKPVLRENVAQTIVTRNIDIKSRNGYLLKGMVSSPPSSQQVAGLIVLVEDQPFESVSREYNPMVNYLCANGLMVLQVDHVGVSGYGKKHRVTGIGELDGKMIDDLADGVLACMSQQIYSGRKVGVAGSGFGGHAAMLCLLKYSDVFSVYICETGMMTAANYSDKLMEETPSCAKSAYQYYINNAIPSCSDLSGAFQSLTMENPLDERLLMAVTPESVLFDASEALNIATLCEQRNVGTNIVELGMVTSSDRKIMSRMDYYYKMVDVIRIGLKSSKMEK